MIKFLAQGYTKEELSTAADLLVEATGLLQLRECTGSEPYCPTCASRHLCGDLYRTTGYLRRKAASRANHAKK